MYSVITDLKHRLENTRPLTPPLEGTNFEYGFNTITLEKIIQYWYNNYNWTEREKHLNKYPQFLTQIQGLDIHFVHVTSGKTSGASVEKLPILLLNGWPGSISEFYPLIQLLKEPKHGMQMEIVAATIPGYGFSQAAARPGMGPGEIGVIFKELMARLGYKKFYIHGEDWGSAIGSTMSTIFPENILGFHSAMCVDLAPSSYMKLMLGSIFPSLVVPEKHQHQLYPLSKFFSFILEEFGYSHIQATKPDTIGVALTDSPAGLAAYILEKFSTWTNPNWRYEKDGGLTDKFTYETLLDNVMIYWVTGSITTSMRLYAETMNKRYNDYQLSVIPTPVPTACTRFKNEILYIPDTLVRHKFLNLVHSVDIEDGGHFPAVEVPELLMQDLWDAIVKMRKIK